MDALRGVALFGVFLVNLTSFASTNVMATEEQLLLLPTAPIDLTLFDVLEWLAVDKANTLFAFLFGLGFFLQMQRLEARGVDFERLYRRRLFVLLAFGLIHTFFIWVWDILHLYALAGFALLALRRLSNRALLISGAVCGALGRVAQKALEEFAGASTWTGSTDGYDQASVLIRQGLSQHGDYLGLVRNFFSWTVIDYLASGLIVGWLFYALGRFLIGAWVGRHGWIARARDFLPGWRRTLRWSLPLGLVLEGASTLLAESPLLPDWQQRAFVAGVFHLFAVPVLSTGYVSAVVVGFQSERGRKLLAPFAWAGRMALTNYLTQSLIIAFVLFGVGPGLALAGKIGTAALMAIVIVCYALQMAFSRWWLTRYAYGPMEWVWRALTYGKLPIMRPLATSGVMNE
jgi:uncharacterized protein